MSQEAKEYITQLTNQLEIKIKINKNQKELFSLHSDPHHLDYLLKEFIRLELVSIQEPAHQTFREYSKPPTTSSSSILWSTISSTLTSLAFQQQSDDDHTQKLEYLYSVFTRLSSLEITPSSTPSNSVRSYDPSTRIIEPIVLLEGYEDLPKPRSRVSLSPFKSLWSCYIDHLDPRLFSGWFSVSINLRKLEIRDSGIADFDMFFIETILLDYQAAAGSAPKTDSNVDSSELGRDDDEEQVKPSEEQLNSQDEEEEHHETGREESTLLLANYPCHSWTFLNHLCLSNNQLTFMSNRSLIALSSLKSIDLSNNLFVNIPEGFRFIPNLKSVNLAFNMIDSLDNIGRCLANVKSLNLSNNRISSLSGIQGLNSIERLDLRVNQIQDIQELKTLSDSNSLTNLWVSSNPCIQQQQQQDWRDVIFAYFQTRKDPSIDLKIDNQSQSTTTTTTISSTSNNQFNPISISRNFVRLSQSRSTSFSNFKSIQDLFAASPSQSRLSLTTEPSSYTSPVDHLSPSSSSPTDSHGTTIVASVTRRPAPNTIRKKPARIVDFREPSSSSSIIDRSRLIHPHLKHVNTPIRSFSNPNFTTSTTTSSSVDSKSIRPRLIMNDSSSLERSQSQSKHPNSATTLESKSPPPASSSSASSSIPRSGGTNESSSGLGYGFRSKIEALKNELGDDTWLKVLGETEFGGT
ncbi:hypothetical protein KEM48_004550 [Puccinia striiformis f. sp. tritici PST-130]|nr:hypothetical protein Pst134EB_023492 [Puccinia striiformis f. sp. tritici]KAI9611309.1 hypothetical protein KEM48_004550 [Puccinia striiformis f. sp. tritici PST-130]